jgi:Type VI secretion system/phage-baseplate injector OB domain
MSQDEFQSYITKKPGPFIAEVTNHLDKTYMGELEVCVIRGGLGQPTVYNQSWTVNVKYLSPFMGVTSARFEGNNSKKFDDVQKSYGMWMVPPDVGNKVLVIFVEGNINQGYWIGCVPDDLYQNHMIPGIAASSDVALTLEQQRKYGTTHLPVAEFLKKTNNGNNPKTSKLPKPVHPFADRLLEQGLILDRIRGVTSSSARREVPSRVFGISTPGPVDTRTDAPTGKIGYEGNSQFPISRLGGSTFVMDDGDVNGQNELVRIRTRTGHQILLHNSQDLIYIANSKGTAWIEMTSAGKLDIYAADSVSIHTETDFNFLADRDVNIEAGRNFNVKSGNDMNINVTGNYNLLVDEDGKVQFSGNYDQKINSSYNTSAATVNLSSKGNLNLSGNVNNFTAAGSTNISSGGDHLETASNIHMNGPVADRAPSFTPATPSPLPQFSATIKSPNTAWATNYYSAGSIKTIMNRVPTHEPWDQHENFNPDAVNSYATDSFVGSTDAARTGQVSSANSPVGLKNTNQPDDWAEDMDFINKTKEVSDILGCNYIDLLACMAFETGRTFDPSLRNRIGATGLIQFLSSTAQGLGTTTDYLAGLTRTQQMDWVLKYLQKTPLPRVKTPGIDDIYMSILYPEAVGQSSDFVLFRAGTKAYEQNPLDLNGKGYVTKSDAASKPKQLVSYVKQQLGVA